MRRRKGVVDENIAVLGEFVDKGGVVLLLALMEAGVFEQQNVAVLHRGDRLRRRSADAVAGESHRALEQIFDRRGDGAQRVFLVGRALGATKMREQDHFPVLVGDFPDRRQHALDARRVRDAAFLHRHVEIHAQENALAADVYVVEGFEGGHFGDAFSMFFWTATGALLIE